jgi:hypothetical protein
VSATPPSQRRRGVWMCSGRNAQVSDSRPQVGNSDLQPRKLQGRGTFDLTSVLRDCFRFTTPFCEVFLAPLSRAVKAMFSARYPRFIAAASPTFRSASRHRFVSPGLRSAQRILPFSTSRTSYNGQESSINERFPDPTTTKGAQRFREFGVGCIYFSVKPNS